ncbi:MAG: hypothetical protein N4A46_10825 [Schleiferiaceae bacterium]|jgi:hypothetical protein|nr:hypothetical protein [Schleiferiaceae bacterium]
MSLASTQVHGQYMLRDYFNPPDGLHKLKGSVKEIVQNDSKGLYGGSTIYSFDDDGKFQSAKSFSSKGNERALSAISMYYDKEGRPAIKVLGKDSIYYTYENDLIATIRYARVSYSFKYDAKNDLQSLKVLDLEGKETSSMHWYRNEKGNVIGKTVYNGGYRTDSLFFKLDPSGNRIKSIGENKTSLQTFDSHDNVILKVDEETDGNVTRKTSYTYFYDEQGNWVEKKVYNGKNLIRQTKRVITYLND